MHSAQGIDEIVTTIGGGLTLNLDAVGVMSSRTIPPYRVLVMRFSGHAYSLSSYPADAETSSPFVCNTSSYRKRSHLVHVGRGSEFADNPHQWTTSGDPTVYVGSHDHLEKSEPQQDATPWDDLICMNPTDLAEKGRQVQMMGRIFQSAQRGFVWLGKAAEDSD